MGQESREFACSLSRRCDRTARASAIGQGESRRDVESFEGYLRQRISPINYRSERHRLQTPALPLQQKGNLTSP